MRIYYENTEITNLVQVRECIVHDTAGKRCDSLNIEFENAAIWDHWGPKEDDQIIITQGRYDSGTMYVNTMQQEAGRYRIYATALPCKARNKESHAFINCTIEEIMRYCAAVSNMDFSIYGLDPKTSIPYIERDDEGCAAFLSRLLLLEGAVLKCVNGKYTAIGLSYAQELPVRIAIEVNSHQKGLVYRRNGCKARRVNIRTPYVDTSATDTAVDDSHPSWSLCSEPVLNNIQGGRWARGILLHANRKCEQIELSQKFNDGLTAMTRVDVSGIESANGQWIVEDVEHDIKNLRTRAVLYPCITTII